MKVNVYDIEQFPDGKKYRLYFTIKKGRATDPVLEITKGLAEHPDILRIIKRRVEKQLVAQELLERQTMKFGKGDIVLYGIQPDREFNFNDTLIKKGSLLLATKREVIRAGELGIVLRDRETRIEIVQPSNDIGQDTSGFCVLGVLTAVYDHESRKIIDFEDKVKQDIGIGRG